MSENKIDNAVDGISLMLDKYVKSIHEKSEAKENWHTVTKTLYDSIAEVERLKGENEKLKAMTSIKINPCKVCYKNKYGELTIKDCENCEAFI